MEQSGPGGTRKSPRNCVRKVKQSVKQDLLEHCGVNKSSKKRKSVSFEKEESDSDDDFECDASEPHKKVQGYRCSPHLVPELMAALTEKQLGWVRKMDFESLGKMIDSRCPKSLVMWLVDRVDTAKGTIDVCGEEIDIRKAVKGIIGLPCGPICVPEPLNGRSKAKRSKCGNDTAGEKHSDKGRGQSAKETTRRLLDENEDEVAFCQTFVMLVLCIYLAPISSLNVNRGYMPALIDISKIPHMDWCGYIAEYLIRGIEEYKRSTSSHVQVAGCVHILPLLYLDALVKLDAIVLPEALALPDGSPRFGYIGTQHLDFLASADFKCKSKERTQYGKLQARRNFLKEQQEKSSGGVPGSNVNVEGSSRFCSDGGDCAASVVEGGEAAFLDLLMEEIKGGRESFLEEIGRQMRMREEDIVNRFKLQFVKHIGLMKDKLGGAVEHASSPKNLEKGSAPESVVETGKQSERSGFEGKGTPERFVGSRNVRAQDIGISRSVSDTPVIASRELDRVFPGVASELKTSDHEHNLGEDHFVENDTSTRIGPSTSEVRGIQTSLFEHASENLCPDVDLAAKCSIGGEENLNRNAVSSSRSYDELTEVVGIGKEAAREASMYHISGETHYSDDVHLSLLCETAASEMFPIYDKSPLCEPDASFTTTVTPSAAKFGSQVEKVQLKTPVFDESPETPSMVAAMRSGKFHALLSIPEICQSQDVPDGAPPSDIRLTESKGEEGAEQPTDATEDAVRLSDEPISLSTQRNNNSGACSSAASMESGYEDENESEDLPTAEPCILSDDEDFQFHSSSNSILTPSYTNESDQLKNAVAEPPLPPPRDIRHIPPLQKEIPNGCRFRFGCSVTSATGKLYDKFNNIELNEAGVEEAAILKFVLCQDASETYKNHVTNSSARVAKKLKGVFDPNRAKTKIQIKRFHVIKGEFFDAMKPTGEVCRNLMGLCSAAIMCDWETKKRLILDQPTIMELMKPGHKCDQKKVALKLRKMNIEEVEELFLPVLIVNHWILIVVDLTAEMAFFFDSVRDVRADYHPHSALWDNLAGNLQEAYSIAMMKTVTMVMYGYTYPVTRKQTNNHDCGFHVIQGMECYKSEDVFGYAEKKTQLPYRKYLCHVLVYHRFNDLNPNREALREEAP